MKRTKEEAEQTRKKLLDTALHEFLETGFSESRLEDIAEKAGVTRGALYWHFKDKNDLFESIMDYKDLESLKVTTKVFNSSTPPFERLKNLVSMNFPELGSTKKEKNYVRIKTELYNYWNLKGDKKKIGETFIYMCKDLLQQCKKNGELKDGIDPGSAAQTILFICAGSYVRFNAAPANLRSIKKSKKLALEYLSLIHK